MNKFKRVFNQVARNVFDIVTGNGLSQEENQAEGERVITPGIGPLMRQCAGESIVLLKNEGRVLPLAQDQTLAVFGRCQNDWFYVGYGSGGDVHPPYEVSLMDGLKAAGVPLHEELAEAYAAWSSHPDHAVDHGFWGHWPYFYPEMPLEEGLVSKCAKESDAALVIIGRAAGEDRENRLAPGSYYLTDLEKDMLQKVTAHFKKVILLMNCGSVIDLSFLQDYPIHAVLYAWQLGQESGNAVADVLTGKVAPSGKLSDTIARKYEDYPSAAHFGNREYNEYFEDIFVGYRYFDTFGKDVLFPFGFGLSYTTFDIQPISAARQDGIATLNVQVTNTGNRPGKEVVQVYAAAPVGALSKASHVLVAYSKTDLLTPGESQTLTLTIHDEDFSSFDDSGITGFSHAFVLEKGYYSLCVGNSSVSLRPALTFELPETILVRQCEDACGPAKPFPVLTNAGTALCAASSRDLRQRILDELPAEIPYTGDKGILFSDVAAGNASLEDFIAQLSDKELADLSRGEGPMNSPFGVRGNAGGFGAITEQLRAKGIPTLITADGPAGLRLKRYTSLLPCATAIACSWNAPLTEEMFQKIGEECSRFEVDVLLSPGMNIHRNVLCGRNFEYYSEDPFLCGKTAAAAVRGIQRGGVSACPKHFACNNQEINRNRNDSRVSARALREIYFKCFEICVKEAKPQNLMTSYNKINGVWSHYNYDLVTTVLRKEWGYEGNILTDWWMQRSPSPEFPAVKDNAYRVRAQVDVLMPGSLSRIHQKYVFDKAQLETMGKPDGLTRAELQRCTANVLRFALTRMK